MKKVLFIVRSFSGVGAQPLRFRMLTEYIKDIFEVHVLEIDHYHEGLFFENGIYIHRIRYSLIGKHINPPQRQNKTISTDNISHTRCKFIQLKASGKKILRKFLFPDSVVFERKNLIEKTNALVKKFDFQIVIASGFPFTTLFISKTIKTRFPSVKFIYDIGDPFFLNSQNGMIRNFFARKFEYKYLKYVNTLVVNNLPTYNHYLQYFGEVIKHRQIEIIPMGAPSSLIGYIKNSAVHNIKSGKSGGYRLVYAGQFYKDLREPFELFKAINVFNATAGDNPVHLDIYGTVSDFFKPYNIDGTLIFFKGYATNDKIIEAYLNCDLIVFIDNAYGIQTPGKIFEISVIGKPILFISDNKKSSAYSIVRNLDHIFHCKNEAKKILYALNSIDYKVDIIKINQIRDEFSWEKRAKEYIDLINA